MQKVWRLFHDETKNIKNNCANEETLKILHQTIKKVSEDINNLRFNTAVSQLMIFTNHLVTLSTLDRDVLNTFLVLLNPFAPHLSEEINAKLGNETIASMKWPQYDNSLIIENTSTIAVQFNGKMRGTIEIEFNSEQKAVRKTVMADKNLKKFFESKEEIKVIYIPNKLINFVLKNLN